MWTNQDGEKFNTLVEQDIAKATSFSYKWFEFKFNDAVGIDATSIALKIQSFFTDGFNAYEFAKWLFIRGIEYKMKFIPYTGDGILQLLNYYIFYKRIRARERKWQEKSAA